VGTFLRHSVFGKTDQIFAENLIVRVSLVTKASTKVWKSSGTDLHSNPRSASALRISVVNVCRTYATTEVVRHAGVPANAAIRLIHDEWRISMTGRTHRSYVPNIIDVINVCNIYKKN